MKKLFLLSCLLSTTYALFAQKTGLLLNDVAYRKFTSGYDARQSSRGARGNTGEVTQPYHSLKAYCPQAGRQWNSSCVGWAVGYGAMTILRAKRFGITNPEEVTQLAHSASYIYNQIAESDISGTYLDTAFRLLKHRGVCRNWTFNSNTQFHGRPSLQAHQEASRFTIADYDIVFKPDAPPFEQVEALQQKLLENIPIILAIEAPRSFIDSGKYTLPIPTNAAEIGAHALCLIGFDNRDSTFEVFNSAGQQWGNNGFLKLKQSELLSMIRQAYWMKLPPARIWRTSEVLFIRHGKDTTGKPTLQDVEMDYNPNSFPTYKAQKMGFDETTRFDLGIRELYAEQFVYIFGRDPKAQWIHYQTITTERNLVETMRQYEFTQKGSELVFILISPTEIEDYKKRFERMKTTRDKVENQIHQAFGDLLAPATQVEYLPYRVGISYLRTRAAIVGFSLEAQ